MNKEYNPMTFVEVGDVATWGSGIVSEADPIDKNQKFDSKDALRKRFLQKHANKVFTVAELLSLDNDKAAA